VGVRHPRATGAAAGTLRPRRVYETVVYAPDLEAATAFYAGVLGLQQVADMAFRLDDDGILLLFDPAQSSRPGRPVPSHGPSGGSVHVAFSVDELEPWRERLAAAGVEIEDEHEWARGGARSLYVRDPAGNSVELVEGDLWPR
jgi:catechol 2,3-dioxygenase-like lactoylglutathione lyase family enzyme